MDFQMTKKQIKTLMIVFVIVALIVFLSYVFTLNKGQEVFNNQEDSPGPPINDVKENQEVQKENLKPLERQETQLELDIESVARNFTERYGSWSNHNQNNNFKSSKIYMTGNMELVLDNFIANNEKLNDNSVYYGINTKVLNVQILESTVDSASVKVNTQRKQVLDNTETIYYQVLNLFLVYKDEWLVNDADWE